MRMDSPELWRLSAYVLGLCRWRTPVIHGPVAYRRSKWDLENLNDALYKPNINARRAGVWLLSGSTFLCTERYI